MTLVAVNPLIAALHRQVRSVVESPAAMRYWVGRFKAELAGGWRPPTDEQAKSGDYPKRAIVYDGLPVIIETPAWTFRRGRNPDGTHWVTRNWLAYGYIPRTDGADGEGLDVYVMPGRDVGGRVYIVRQRDPRTGRYDEDKVMLGFPSKLAAVLGYLVHYDQPGYFGGITSMPMREFKSMLLHGLQRWNAKPKYRMAKEVHAG